jgi:hypothetical protein
MKHAVKLELAWACGEGEGRTDDSDRHSIASTSSDSGVTMRMKALKDRSSQEEKGDEEELERNLELWVDL